MATTEMIERRRECRRASKSIMFLVLGMCSSFASLMLDRTQELDKALLKEKRHGT